MKEALLFPLVIYRIKHKSDILASYHIIVRTAIFEYAPVN